MKATKKEIKVKTKQRIALSLSEGEAVMLKELAYAVNWFKATDGARFAEGLYQALTAAGIEGGYDGEYFAEDSIEAKK